MNKKRFIVGLAVAIVGVATILISSQIHLDKSSTFKTVVYEMYTFECEVCGYKLAEGEFGYIDNTGWERCPECNMYREITSPRY